MNDLQLRVAIEELEALQDTVFALYKKHKQDGAIGDFYGSQNNKLTDMRIKLENQLKLLK